jgi:hypothetical protein
MTAGKRHEEAVARIVNLGEALHWKHIWNDSGPYGNRGWKLPYPLLVTWQRKPYQPIVDCMFQVATDSMHLNAKLKALVAFEVDGMQRGGGHSSHRGQAKDGRKAGVLAAFGIMTVRFTIDELVGKRAITDSQILEQISHTLETGQIRKL